MKKTLFYFAILMLSTPLFAQMEEASLFITHDHDHVAGTYSCGHDGGDILLIKGGGHSFASNQEAIQVVNDIMNAVGLKSNFKVDGAQVQNAAAVIMKEDRYILYNPTWISKVSSNAKTYWAGISIIAHEIGHHLNGHTLLRSGSRPKTELEADEFSGFVLRRMGASLGEAQAAMKLLANPLGSSTHPPQSQRLRAIEKGWRNADSMSGGTTKVDVPTTKPNKKPRPSKKEQESDKEEEVTEADEKPSSPPVKKPKRKVRPAYAQYSVVLTSNPNRTFYITTSNQFVMEVNNRIMVLGQVKKTGNEKYPYVIDVENNPDLFIDRYGELFTRKGSVVGQLEQI